MTNSGDEQAKLEQLSHICDQLLLHESELSTKQEQVEAHQADNQRLEEQLANLEATLAQRKPMQNSPRQVLSARLEEYNQQLQQLETNLQSDKEKQRARQASDEDDIQKCIRQLSGIELKLRTGKSQQQSPAVVKKEQERTISDLSRSIQRKELKLKEVRLMSQRYDSKPGESSPKHKLEHAHSRQLQMKVRALEAHIESTRYKKEQEYKLKLEEVESRARTTIEQSKRSKNAERSTVQKLRTQQEQLQAEQQKLTASSEADRLALMDLNRQFEQLTNSLQELKQQGEGEGTYQNYIRQLTTKNEAEQQQLAFIKQSTTALLQENNAISKQASDLMSSKLRPVDRAAEERIEQLQKQIRQAIKLTDALDAELKTHFVSQDRVEELRRQVAEEQKALEEMPEMAKENEKLKRDILDTRKETVGRTLKPDVSQVELLKTLVDEKKKQQISIERSNIELRDQLDQLRRRYDLTSEPSLPTQSAMKTEPQEIETEPDAHSPISSAPPEEACLISEQAWDQMTLEEYIRFAYFRHRPPKHQTVLTQFLLLIVVSFTFFTLTQLLLK